MIMIIDTYRNNSKSVDLTRNCTFSELNICLFQFDDQWMRKIQCYFKIDRKTRILYTTLRHCLPKIC